MDITTIIGFILGVGLISGAIMMQTSLATFIDPASVAIVVGGSAAAAFVAFPLQQVVRVLVVLKKAFFSTPVDTLSYVRTLVRLAEVARRDGILSLESQLNEGSHDPFMVRGLRMAIDGQDRAIIEGAMESELESMIERHGQGKALFDNLGKYAPAFGMIGTLVGLVIMLQNMSDPESLGPAMAVAMITTFYGAVIANLFAMPVADKLNLRSNQEIAVKTMIVHGVLSIQAGDNPRIVQQKLAAFLDDKQRTLLESEKQQAS
jgi:chemotaxis protein MotA